MLIRQFVYPEEVSWIMDAISDLFLRIIEILGAFGIAIVLVMCGHVLVKRLFRKVSP
jgi:hypothetical protein